MFKSNVEPLLLLFVLGISVVHTSGTPSINSNESLKVKDVDECETCDWRPQFTPVKLALYQRNGIILDRCVQPGTIALTFDDGPYIIRTPEVLNILKIENVTATFFVNGDNYWPPIDHDEPRHILRRAEMDGHYIASHTWAHTYLTNQTEESVKYEMNQLSDQLFEILGKRPVFMRPPYGRFNDTVIDLIYGENGDLGYKFILWSICTCDWAHEGNSELSLAEYIR